MFRDLLSRDAAARPRVCGRIGRAFAVGVLLGSASHASALGLGEIELDSSLNEKLDARIELFDAEGLQPTEVIVSLASADDFDRIGVERFFFLTDLRFEVDFEGGQLRDVQVTSTQPVTEPYLNFLVEVLWPSGRMLKEYTLLLDPPTFSPAPAPSVAAPAQARQRDAGAGGAGRVQRDAASDAASGTRVQLAPGRSSEPSPLDEGVIDGEYRMTDRSDTLWSIASRTRPSNAVSVQQNMLAIQRLNPEAFLQGNINLLKAGYTLRLPDEQQALSLSAADAGQQVAMQNEDWRALQRGEPVPTRQPAAEQQVAQEVRSASGEAQSAELRTPVDASPDQPAAEAAALGPDGQLRIVAGAGDTATGSADPATAEALNAAQEEQDRLTREVESLTDALDREKELASNQIAVKDRQLEVRDQQIAEMQAQMEQLRRELEQQPPAESQNQSASATEAWWQSPFVLWGGAGVVVLLLVYGLIAARRRRAAEDEFYPEVEETGAFDEPAVATGEAFADAPDTADEPAVAAAAPVLELDDEEPAVAPGAAATASAESGSQQTSDVIGEADIYIAYGRYPQAIGLLLGVLEEDPERNDVRLKLLELYAETRDREAFDAHMAELVNRCDDDEALLTARELSQQFGGDDDEITGVPDVAALDDTAVDLEDLSGSDTASAELGTEDDLPAGAEDFELELDDLAGEPAARRSAEAHPGDDLGGDLGIDFDPERDSNGEAAPADLEAADLGTAGDLDLDLDDGDALGDDAFDFGDEGDTASTKLDLARAYIDMGDQDGARDILNEVVSEGNADQQQRAQSMLEEL